WRRDHQSAIRNLDHLAFDTCWFHEYCTRSTGCWGFFFHTATVSQKKKLCLLVTCSHEPVANYRSFYLAGTALD
ncbi:hypothetical protein PVAP13_2KG115516, partial [Panicum virgatum]